MLIRRDWGGPQVGIAPRQGAVGRAPNRQDPGRCPGLNNPRPSARSASRNGSELARAFGVSQKTVRGYLDTVCATFMAKRLEPWHENVAKRQVKAPKIYLEDSGILHTLLGLESLDDLLSHPKVGASWEGFAIGEVVAHLGARPEECFFWKLHSGAELDLLIRRGNLRRGFELKLTSSPRVTPSMR